MKHHNWMTVFLPLGIIFYVFQRWFLDGVLSATDFTFLYSERLGEYSWLPSAWSEAFGNGIGGVTFASLNLDLYLHIGIRLFVFFFHIPWNVAQRILFFWPYVLVGSAAAYYLISPLLKDKRLAVIGVMVYMANTYNLMIAGGGQVGLMMAYAVAPFVLGSVMRKNPIIFAISSIAFIIFDIRYAYILYACIACYVFFVVSEKDRLSLVRRFFLPSLWVVAANLFWLIPLIFSPSFGLPEGYGDQRWLRYLSWAEFSKTFSLLHPNWPENIFGKTYFMKPEFLLLPVVVFSPFLWGSFKTYVHKRIYTFFSLLIMIGALLAKGVNPPFPDIYNWLFVHLPLFNGFRDPTKFYLITALSYAILIPLAIDFFEANIASFRRSGVAVAIKFLRISFIIFWGVIILTPFWQGSVRGTFERVTIPAEYTRLERLIQSDPQFSRIMSIPWRQRFVFQSEKHPLVNLSDILKSSDFETILDAVRDPEFEHTLRIHSVRYIVIPIDSMEEIFLTDRNYDETKRLNFIKQVDALPYLTRDTSFKNLVVYEYKKYPGHFYIAYENNDFIRQPEIRTRPTLYFVDIKDVSRPITLYFSEAYDPGWVLWDGEKYIPSERTEYGLNSFTLDTTKTTRVSVWYKKETILHRAYIVTAVALGVLLILTLIRRKKIKIRKTHFIAFIGIPLLLGAVLLVARQFSSKNLLTDTRILFSQEWLSIYNPINKERYRGARFGGSSIFFRIANASHIAIKAEGANQTKDEQVLEIQIDDQLVTLSSPFPDERLRIPITKSGDPRLIRISLFCDSALIPCDVRITELSTDYDAHISTPDVPRETKTVAVLGDSITSSFGKKNYSTLLTEKLGGRLHNAAVFGSSVSPVPGWDNALMRVHDDITVFSPDIALLVIGTNDLGRSIPLDIFEKNYRSMIVDIKRGSPQTQIICFGLLIRKDFSIETIRAYSSVIKKVSAEFSLPYIEPINWLSYEDLQDQVHPSVQSQEKIAEHMYRAIVNLRED